MSAPLQQLQQNEVHHHHQQLQQQPPITTTIDFMDLINSGFSTLYNHNKDLDDAAVKHMRLKNDIFLNCLNAKGWKPLRSVSGEDIFVSPKYAPPDFFDYADQAAAIAAAATVDGFDFENSIEGVAFVHPCNYGRNKSGKTLDHYNELYAREVLGTEVGRRLIQQHLPSTSSPPTTTMEVDQVQVDNRKKLENDTFNYLMGNLKRLSIGEGTNLHQIDDAINVSKSVQERLEDLKDRHLEREKNKRQLELVSQNELVLSLDNNKKQRTDTNQDAVREDSISASTPMEEDSDVDSVDEDASQTVEFECDDKDVTMTTDSPLSSTATLTLPDNLNTSDNESQDEVTLVDGTVSGNDNDQLPTTSTTINSPPTSQPSNHDIESSPPLDNQVDSSQLTTYLQNTHTTLSKYKTKSDKNTAITAKSNKMLAAFKDIPNCINALELSTDELDSLKILTQLDITNETTSGSLFDAFQTQYGTGAKKINNLILPELKAESYNNVQRCNLIYH